jgi:deoxyribodipyrimidine photo-lyase
LHQSLRALGASLRERGSRLVLATGRTEDALTKLVVQTKATAVYWNRRYEPAALECSASIAKALATAKVAAATFNSALLAEPNDILNLSGKPYRVYTYLRRLRARPAAPAAPAKLTAPKQWPRG